MTDELPQFCPGNKKQGVSQLDNIQVKQFKPHDPRFENIDDFKVGAFRNSYSFLTDLRRKENEQLREHMGDMSEGKDIEQIRARLNKNKSKIRQQEVFKRSQEIRKELRESELAAVRAGEKQRYFLSNKQLDRAVRARLFMEKRNIDKTKAIKRKYMKTQKHK